MKSENLESVRSKLAQQEDGKQGTYPDIAPD